MSFSGQKMHFFGKNGNLTHWAARGSKVVLECFVWGLISYLSMKKKNWRTLEEKMSDQFFSFDPHIFCTNSPVLVLKQVLDNIFQSIIVTYNFCVILHSLIFSFNLADFGPKQNPTGLLEAIQRSDQNSKTTLIIKSTLERSFLVENHHKNLFWNIELFTRFNLYIFYIKW